jgi:hypothetical protein
MRAGRLNPFLPAVAPNLEARLLLPLDPSLSARPHLGYIQRVCSHHGASLLVGFIPESVTVSDYYRRFWEELGAKFRSASLATPEFRQQQVALAGSAAGLGIPFVDTTAEVVAEEAGGRRLYFGYDTHMNQAGYALVARALTRRFEQERAP